MGFESAVGFKKPGTTLGAALRQVIDWQCMRSAVASIVGWTQSSVKDLHVKIDRFESQIQTKNEIFILVSGRSRLHFRLQRFRRQRLAKHPGASQITQDIGHIGGYAEIRDEFRRRSG